LRTARSRINPKANAARTAAGTIAAIVIAIAIAVVTATAELIGVNPLPPWPPPLSSR